MDETSDNTRIERMLAEGKLTAAEAERLRATLADQQARAAPYRAVTERSGRRRLARLIGGLMASTLVTLVLIPVTYATVAGWVARGRASRRSWPDGEADNQATA